MLRVLILAVTLGVALAGCECQDDISALYKINAALERRIEMLEKKIMNGM